MKLRLPKQLCAALMAAAIAPLAQADMLDSATLSIGSFDETTLNGLKESGWSLDNVISASSDGVMTTTGSSLSIGVGTSGQTLSTLQGGTNNRWRFAAVVTIKASDVDNLNSFTRLLMGVEEGLGANNANIFGAYSGDTTLRGTISKTKLVDNGNGTYTLGVAYNGNDGTAIYAQGLSASDGGLKSGGKTETITFAPVSGLHFSNLYWFNDTKSAADMSWMVIEAGSHEVFTWNGTNSNNTWTNGGTSWTSHGEDATFSASASDGQKNSVIFGSAAANKTVNVAENITMHGGMRVEANGYAFNFSNGATLGVDTLSDALTGTNSYMLKGSGTLAVNGNSVGSGVIKLEGTTLALNKGDMTFGAIVTTNNGQGNHKTSHITIGTAGDDATTAKVSIGRLEMGDIQNAGQMSTLTINSGSALRITGGTNGSDFKTASLLLGEWKSSVRADILGSLLAQNAKLLIGDAGDGADSSDKVVVNVNGGTLAVKGIDRSKVNEKPSKLELNVTNQGKLILGDGGIGAFTGAQQASAFTFNNATLGISADAVTIVKGLSLAGATTIDTRKYTFASDGFSVNRSNNGGTLTISGALSGTGDLTKEGAGTLKLTGDNSGYGSGSTLGAHGGSTIVSGNVASSTGALAKLSVGAGGSLTVETGANIYTSQLIMSDANGLGNTTINGGIVHVTGTANAHNTSASLLLSHWGHSSTLTINGGELDAAGAEAHLSWTGTGTLSLMGGTAKVLGINFWAQDWGGSGDFRGSLLLGDGERGGSLELGANGMSNARNDNRVNIQFGYGTLKATADSIIGWNPGSNKLGSENGATISLVATEDSFTTLDTNSHTLSIGNKLEGSGNVKKVGEGSLSLGGHLKTTGTITIEAGTIDLKTTGIESNEGRLSFSDDADISITKRADVQEATLSNVRLEAEGDKGIYAASTDGAQVQNADITVSNNATASINNVLLTDSNMMVADGATGTLSDSTISMTHALGAAAHTNTLSGVTIGENVSAFVAYGNTLQFLNQTTSINLNDMVIGSGAKVEAYIGTPTPEQIAAAQNGTADIEQTISVSGKLTVQENAKLNANLELKDGSTISFGDGVIDSQKGLTMGSTVTFEQGGKMNLSDNIINGLNSLTVGEGLTLFSGVDEFNINGAAYNAGTTYKAGDFFNLSNADVAVQRPYDLVVKFGDGMSQSGQSIFLWMETPEPATATLSLLALAALAARRKRK